MKYRAARKSTYQYVDARGRHVSGGSEGPWGPYRATAEEAEKDFVGLAHSSPDKEMPLDAKIQCRDTVQCVKVRSIKVDEASAQSIVWYVEDISMSDLDRDKSTVSAWDLERHGIKTVGDLPKADAKDAWQDLAIALKYASHEYAGNRLRLEIHQAIAWRVGMSVLGELRDRIPTGSKVVLGEGWDW